MNFGTVAIFASFSFFIGVFRVLRIIVWSMIILILGNLEIIYMIWCELKKGWIIIHSAIVLILIKIKRHVIAEIWRK